MRKSVFRRLWATCLSVMMLMLVISCGDKGTEPDVNDAPRITSSSSVQAIIDSLFRYTATASDADGDNITIEFSNVPSWLSVAGNVISGTPTAQTPDTSFTITASDAFLADTANVAVAIVDAPPQVSYSSQIQPIFNNNCGGSQCHIGGMANGLSLQNYTSLMQGGNSGAVVLPGNPNGSILIRRLEGNIQPQMPLGRSPLPQATINLIRQWIAEGAHNN